MATTEVQLRRTDTSQPWGFRLKGGVDQGLPLHVEQVNPKGRSFGAGLRQGDYVVAICGSGTSGMTHMQVKQEILRAGNELDLVIQRDPSLAAAAPQAAQARAHQAAKPEEPRSQVVEESIPSVSGGADMEIHGKTYGVVTQELDDQQGGTGTGGKPASIFDRKRGERSGYLKAKGTSYQKIYGES